MSDGEIPGWDNTFDRVGRRRSDVYYQLEIYTAESPDQPWLVLLDIDSRADLGKSIIGETLVDWGSTHNSRVVAWRVIETMTCAVGGVSDAPPIVPEGAPDSTVAQNIRSSIAKPYQTFDDLDVDLQEGQRIRYTPAGNRDLYGIREGVVVDVGPGTDSPTIQVKKEPDAEPKRIDTDWIVDVHLPDEADK